MHRGVELQQIVDVDVRATGEPSLNAVMGAHQHRVSFYAPVLDRQPQLFRCRTSRSI
jgi:hypothetical protein